MDNQRIAAGTIPEFIDSVVGGCQVFHQCRQASRGEFGLPLGRDGVIGVYADPALGLGIAKDLGQYLNQLCQLV